MAEAVLNVATNDYVYWQKRLVFSLKRVGFAGNIMGWTDMLPENSPPHSKQPYGFKVHAIEEAVKRCAREVLWVDAGLYAIRPLTPIFDAIRRDGYYFVADDNPISRFCSDQTLEYYSMARSDAESLRLVSGALMGFDFMSDLGKDIFSRLAKAYRHGLYIGTVSKHSGSQEHRGDETILGIVASRLGLKQHTLQDHFCADGNIQPTTVFRSGYYEREDIPKALWA